MEEQDWDDTPIAAEAQRAAQILTPHALKLPRPERPRRLATSKKKGGFEKTTPTPTLPASLARNGLKILVVDLDPQGNASTALGVEHREGTVSSYELLLGACTPEQVIQRSTANGNLFCIPATIDLAAVEIELVSKVRREYRLRDALSPEFIKEAGFDYVFVDCPPSLGLLTTNALNAVEEVLIPIQCEYYALEGVNQLLKYITMVQHQLNPQLHISAILLTMFDGRTKLAEEVSADVRNTFGALVLRNRIPRSVKVSEAPGFGQTVLDYDPGSRGSMAYMDAAKELANRGDVRFVK